MEFSDMLTHYRDRSGLNKTALAEKIGVTPEYIITLEKGRIRPPTFERCEQFAKILNLDESERKEFFELAFEERLGEDVKFLDHFKPSYFNQNNKETEKISSEILQAIEDPVAVKALLITHGGSADVKRAIKQLLDTFPNMAPEKRRAILSLCNL